MTLADFIDFFLHAERHLEWFIQNYNIWIYALLFAIIFCETGLIVTPFLPGDSLLFAVGALAGKQLIQVEIVTPLLLVAAILGDAVNYSIGKWMGPKVFHMESSRFFNKAHLMKAHEFYEKYGGRAIILARFVPIVRTPLGRDFPRWRILLRRARNRAEKHEARDFGHHHRLGPAHRLGICQSLDGKAKKRLIFKD